MGVWLRIPLVHPEAMDPFLNAGQDFGKVVDGDGDGDDSGTAEEGVEGAKGESVVEVNEQMSAGVGREGMSVEDPWETWNAVRVMCEHKSW